MKIEVESVSAVSKEEMLQRLLKLTELLKNKKLDADGRRAYKIQIRVLKDRLKETMQ